jgi:hypothetical protein
MKGSNTVINMSQSNNLMKNSSDQIGSQKTFKEILDIIPKSYLTSLKKTDDLIFAQHEIKNIDHKIEKSKYNKKKIWEKSKESIDNKDLNVRKKIMEIKKSVKEKNTLDNLDNKNQKYFSKEHMYIVKYI